MDAQPGLTVSSDMRETPESGTIEQVPLDHVNLDVTTYVAEDDKAPVVEIEIPRGVKGPVRVYVNGRTVYG